MLGIIHVYNLRPQAKMWLILSLYPRCGRDFKIHSHMFSEKSQQNRAVSQKYVFGIRRVRRLLPTRGAHFSAFKKTHNSPVNTTRAPQPPSFRDLDLSCEQHSPVREQMGSHCTTMYAGEVQISKTRRLSRAFRGDWRVLSFFFIWIWYDTIDSCDFVRHF